MSHLEVVQQLYAAFGRCDIPTILDMVSDDVRWEHWDDSFAQRTDVPSLAPRTGRDGVAGFFGSIADWDVTEFDVLDLAASEAR